MRNLRSVLVLVTLLMLSLSAQAARRAGASRALRLDWTDSQPGTLIQTTHVSLRAGLARSPLLIFAREAAGTRNLWQARPGEAGADWTRIVSEGLAWQTVPLTSLAAPFWADEPLSAPDGRTLFCITNAVGNAEFSQIARYDPDTRLFTPLTNERAQHRALALSPDGSKLAFVREVRGVESVYIMPASGGAAQRVLEGARHPAWQNNDTLLLSGARSGLKGLYRLALPAGWAKLRASALRPTLLFPQAGEVAVAPEGDQLCLAPDDNGAAGDARLLLIAADGSNARAIVGTEGAKSPRFLPAGEMLLFDAPIGTARGLWMMPLLKITPTVQILAAHALPGTNISTDGAQTVEIIGTVFSPEIEAPSVRLEVGRGAEPQQWEILPVPIPPLNRERLALWTPPPGARGEWTLRLMASSAEGESAQTTLTVTLPLLPASAQDPPESNASSQTSIKLTPPGFGGLHTEPPRTTSSEEQRKIKILPDGTRVFPDSPRTTPGRQADLVPFAPIAAAPTQALPTPVSPGAAMPAPTPVAKPLPRVTAKNDLPSPAPLTGTLPNSPLPPLPPPPRNTLRAQAFPPARTPAPDILTGDPVRFDAPLPAVPEPAPVSPAAPPRNLQASSVTVLPPVRAAAVLPAQNSKPLTQQAAQSIVIQGTPGVMRAGDSCPVSVSLRNASSRNWDSSGANPVRLLVRWLDANSGMRAQYRIEWLRADVPPGGGALLNIQLKAPSRSGRFRVSFALVKLPNGQYQAPPATNVNSGSDAEEVAGKTLMVTVQ